MLYDGHDGAPEAEKGPRWTLLRFDSGEGPRSAHFDTLEALAVELERRALASRQPAGPPVGQLSIARYTPKGGPP